MYIYIPKMQAIFRLSNGYAFSNLRLRGINSDRKGLNLLVTMGFQVVLGFIFFFFFLLGNWSWESSSAENGPKVFKNFVREKARANGAQIRVPPSQPHRYELHCSAVCVGP